MSQVVVAATFFESARKLDGNDRARVLDFLGKFHTDPRQPGLNLEKIHADDPGMRSARITQGLRAIVHSDGPRFTLLYAAQHDDAYAWAQHRQLRVHPKTGVLQIVETAEEIERELRVESQARPAPKLFPTDRYQDDYLLSIGVPQNWLPTVRHLQNEDQLLRAIERLPEEVAERLLALVAGEVVTPPAPVPASGPLTASPDNLRRFWVVTESELADELQKPLDAWLHFLHPSQRALASKAFKGPVKVTGSAGTGKTVVALHRARDLARQGRNVLLTSFVTTLCQNLERNLSVLCTPEERARIRVATVHAEALQQVRRALPTLTPIEDDALRVRLDAARKRSAPDLDLAFLEAEWEAVVEPLGLGSWDAYRDTERRGRGRGLSVRERQQIWSVFASLQQDLELSEHETWSGLCRRALALLETQQIASPYDAVLVDEVQDLRPIEIRFLAALATRDANLPQLLLCGDAGQRIYPGGFSLRSLGVDVRGRSYTLRVNYRTTEQIRRAADRIAGHASDDLDGGEEHRDRTRSLLRGPEPQLRAFASAEAEAAFIAERVAELLHQGLDASEIAVFARSARALDPIEASLTAQGTPVTRLARSAAGQAEPRVQLGSMHRAKGLEFKIVFVAAVRDGSVPLRSVLNRAHDPADREEALARERRLLYVSLTRARDQAFITWSSPPSPFLRDLLPSQTAPEEIA